MSLFAVLKYLHILAACLWIGSNAANTVLIARLGVARDGVSLRSLLPPMGFVGQFVVGPSAAISLLTGFAMVGLFHIGEGALWVTWGLVGILLSMLLGGFLIRREIASLAVGGASPAGVAQPMTTRLTALNLLNLLILLSVVWVMVAKPA
jgi:hypothetical protein